MGSYEVRYFDLGISSAPPAVAFPTRLDNHINKALQEPPYSLVNPITIRTMYPTRMLRMQPGRAFGLQATRPLFRPVPVSC